MAGQKNPFQKQAPTGLQTFLSQTQYLQQQKKPEEKLGQGLLQQAGTETQATSQRNEKIGEKTQETQKIGSEFQPVEYKAPTVAKPDVSNTALTTGGSLGAYGIGKAVSTAPSSQDSNIIQGIINEGSVKNAPTIGELQTQAANKITEFQQGAQQRIQDYSANVGQEISQSAAAAQSGLTNQYNTASNALQSSIDASKNIGQVGQLSSTEQQAQGLQNVLNQYGTSNIEALSALLGGRTLTPEELALTSQVYQGDIQNLRGQAEQQNIQAERVKSMRDFLQNQLGAQQTATGTELSNKSSAGAAQIMAEQTRAQDQAKADVNTLTQDLERGANTLKYLSSEQLKGYQLQIAKAATDKIKEDISSLEAITSKNVAPGEESLAKIKAIGAYYDGLVQSLRDKDYDWATEALRAQALPLIKQTMDLQTAQMDLAKKNYEREIAQVQQTPSITNRDEYVQSVGTTAGLSSSNSYISDFLSKGAPKSPGDRTEEQHNSSSHVLIDAWNLLPNLKFSYDAAERTKQMDDSKTAWLLLTAAQENFRKYGMMRAGEDLVPAIRAAYAQWQKAKNVAEHPWSYGSDEDILELEQFGYDNLKDAFGFAYKDRPRPSTPSVSGIRSLPRRKLNV